MWRWRQFLSNALMLGLSKWLLEGCCAPEFSPRQPLGCTQLAFAWGKETVLRSIQVCSGGLESSFSSWAKEEEKQGCNSNIQLRKAQRSSLRHSQGCFPVPS